MPKVVIVVLVVVAVAFAASVALATRHQSGAEIDRPDRQSLVRGIDGLAPKRKLKPDQIVAACFNPATAALAFSATTPCAFTVADGVDRVVLVVEQGNPQATLRPPDTAKDIVQIERVDDAGRIVLDVFAGDSRLELRCPVGACRARLA